MHSQAVGSSEAHLAHERDRNLYFLGICSNLAIRRCNHRSYAVSETSWNVHVVPCHHAKYGSNCGMRQDFSDYVVYVCPAWISVSCALLCRRSVSARFEYERQRNGHVCIEFQYDLFYRDIHVPNIGILRDRTS